MSVDRWFVWPETVEEAATALIQVLDYEQRESFRQTKPEDMFWYHMSLGVWVRNTFGLWAGNAALLADSGCEEPDGCSMRIIEAAWKRLRFEGDP